MASSPSVLADMHNNFTDVLEQKRDRTSTVAHILRDASKNHKKLRKDNIKQFLEDATFSKAILMDAQKQKKKLDILNADNIKIERE